MNARITRNACHPYSGREFQAWIGDKCVLETDDLDAAKRAISSDSK